MICVCSRIHSRGGSDRLYYHDDGGDDDDDGDVSVANMNVKIIVCKVRLIRASQAMMWTPVIGLPVCTVLCWSEGVAVNKVPVLLYR